ncbi:hypothetical protein WMY93_023756 [Mugilogobius chulae]|uniref:Uncharacterized protein n=1 Tax=Mugilogobius chulae TaxID=88201 RepID=A0AAW0N543_9GOBI
MQEDIDNGAVEYLHDDSGAASDSFAFRARLRTPSQTATSPAESVVLEEVFNIPIRRRGSESPELVTSDMLLEVLQNSTTILSQKHLNTHDEDSSPDEVHFKITKPPRNGRLLDLTRMEITSDFTQDMINNRQVGFQSDGSLREGFFEFYITDGEHKTESYTIHIGVLAHTLVLTKSPEIKVKQGDDETLITEDMLKATTGGPLKEDVLYKITSVPKYAAVMVDRQPTSAFTQEQIRQGRVSVRFVKSTSPRDTVAFVARSRAANVSSVLNITVQPLANIAKNPTLPEGAKVRVDRKLLDATPLANKTRTSPTFTVIQQPKNARFVISDGPNAGQTVDSFSQQELDDGRVAMEIKPTRSKSKSGVNNDEARFLLKAHGVPPAECVLPFQTSPYNASGVYPVTLLRVPAGNDFPIGTQGIPRMADGLWPTTVPTGTHRKPVASKRSNVWSILIPILVILLLLLLAAILAYYVIRKNKTGKHNVQSASSKPKNGEVAGTETFRKTDAANSIPMTTVGGKDADPELLQHCKTSSPGKNQYWVEICPLHLTLDPSMPLGHLLRSSDRRSAALRDPSPDVVARLGQDYRRRHRKDRELCKCPLCTGEFNKSLQLNVNTLLRDIVDNCKLDFVVGNNSEKPTGPDDVLCDCCLHVKRKAAQTCLICLTSFCETHLEPHLRAEALKSHTLTDPVPKLQEKLCTKHNRILEESSCNREKFCLSCANNERNQSDRDVHFTKIKQRIKKDKNKQAAAKIKQAEENDEKTEDNDKNIVCNDETDSSRKCVSLEDKCLGKASNEQP